jgi:hypothetical protein
MTKTSGVCAIMSVQWVCITEETASGGSRRMKRSSKPVVDARDGNNSSQRSKRAHVHHDLKFNRK